MDTNLKDIVDTIDTKINDLDHQREHALKASREIVRRCGALIMACHRGETEDTLRQGWSEIQTMVWQLRDGLAGSGPLYFSGFVEHAQAEATEAAVVLNICLHEGTEAPTIYPDPEDLGVRETAYLKGLGDVIGELRRFTLERLRNGDLTAATWYYERMEEIYTQLRTLGYTHVSSELRKKMDTGRVLLERTLGELVNIKHMKSLEHEMASRNR